jgi:hypothetical protein
MLAFSPPNGPRAQLRAAVTSSMPRPEAGRRDPPADPAGRRLTAPTSPGAGGAAAAARCWAAAEGNNGCR